MASSRNSVVGIGRQTERGTALAVPKFEHVMGSGRIGGGHELEELPWTSDSESPAGHYTAGIPIDIALTDLPVLPQSAAVWLQAVLGTLATTGAGPYDHEATSGPMPWETLFWQQPSVSTETNKNFIIASDARLGELVVKASGTAPLLFDASGAALALVRGAAKWGAATVVEDPIPHFTSRDAEYAIDIVGSAPAAFTSAGESTITFNRNLDRWRGHSLTDQEIDSTKFDIMIEFGEVRPADNDLWNEIYFGSASGTSLSGADAYGSATASFQTSDNDADNALVFTFNQLRWTASPVETDPSGNPITYSLTGLSSKPLGASEFDVVLSNAYVGTAY